MSTLTFWDHIIPLVKKHRALDLSMGNPDFLPTQEVIDALVQSVTSSDPMMHQYTSKFGHPRLVSALTVMFSKILDRKLDGSTEVTVTSGGIAGLFQSCTGLFKPGDEVILVEPFFNDFVTVVRRSGATPVYVSMKPAKQNSEGYSLSNDWKLDMDELEKSCSEKTKGIILNNPYNPVGKVFTREELEQIAAVCKKHDIIVIADEVYEFLVYDQRPFTKVASVPGMYERTVTIGSGGKSFSVTGWRIGWAIAPPHLTERVRSQYTSILTTPTQEAVAKLLEVETSRLNEPSCSFTVQSEDFSRKRDECLQFLIAAGLSPVKPAGSYFIIADVSKIDFPYDDSKEAPAKEEQFVTWMVKTHKLSATPMNIFYSPKNVGHANGLVRFCFAKKEETIQKAKEILEKLSHHSVHE